jgi:hypothetical protein
MDLTARKLLNLRKKMEDESGVEGRDIRTNVVCLLYDIAIALGYSDRVADQITGDGQVDQPIFSKRKHRSSRVQRRT